MKELDVVTFGETMVLLTPELMTPLEYSSRFYKQVGGAESNVAIGLQRLGHSVGWFSKLGNDPFGRYIHKFVRGEGVDTSRCIYTNEAPTGIFFKEKYSSTNIRVYYYRKNSAASLLSPDDLDEDYIACAKFLHITGITPALSLSCRETVFKAIEIAKKHKVKVVFDPNIRLKLWKIEEARSVLLEIAAEADIILPGLDEGELLSGRKTPEEIASFLGKEKLVVIKLGERGSYYQFGNENGYVKGFHVPQVVDPVGAGDGFAAGIISGLLRNEPIPDAVKRGNAVGAIVVGANGDVEGLPSKEELEEFMKGATYHRDVKR
ncbi:phosphomethylpyrimidine kinase family protein [Geobacillus kaustophilus]|uniref:Phosphomethylpyrimidine kinase family protein n=1 Tax=Geobacillus kaustophilus TaxID=1462 RepID=A0A0D8BWG3_GEOKU|nr:sugar kinase [Geobacillus kaustophilus]KJE28528.1 phosphomethylpyrimidine kinase family protein [Geobacillus kaustophilus]